MKVEPKPTEGYFNGRERPAPSSFSRVVTDGSHAEPDGGPDLGLGRGPPTAVRRLELDRSLGQQKGQGSVSCLPCRIKAEIYMGSW